jgi:threonine/homoserine/homoserine lactone efflux protein
VPPDRWMAFLIFSLVAAITPGPSNVMITATGSAVGFRRGLPCAVGAACGMALLLAGASLGLGQLVMGEPLVVKIMNGCGAAFLLWLAWRIFRAPPLSEPGGFKPVGFAGAALFQWANPKGWLVAIGAASAFAHGEGSDPLLHALASGVLFFLAALPSGLLWLGLGAAMHGLLRDERNARLFNGLMAAALAASVALILL